jgi:hypothetical protein
MPVRTYLKSEFIASPEHLKNIQTDHEKFSQLTGIHHNVDVIDGQIALVWVDTELIDSGEYHRKVTAFVERSLGSIFSTLEEAVIENQMGMPEGDAAARQIRDFFGMR